MCSVQCVSTSVGSLVAIKIFIFMRPLPRGASGREMRGNSQANASYIRISADPRRCTQPMNAPVRNGTKPKMKRSSPCSPWAPALYSPEGDALHAKHPQASPGRGTRRHADKHPQAGESSPCAALRLPVHNIPHCSFPPLPVYKSCRERLVKSGCTKNTPP